MYLYNKNSNKIEVYSIKPNKNKIYKFKREQIGNISNNKLFLRTLTNSNRVLEDEFAYMGVENLTLNYKKDYFYHSLISYYVNDKELERQQEILENYYNDISSNKVVKVFNNNNINFLLLLEPKYKKIGKIGDVYAMKDIVIIPESLYYLELFLNGIYELISNKNFIDQADLFDISKTPIDIIDVNEIKKAEKFNLITSSKNLIPEKLEESQKILKLLRR